MSISKWVAVWGSAPSYTAPNPRRYTKDMTMRYTLRAMLSGSRIRLHLNNLYGKEDVTITRMFVGAEGREILPVTFGGETACHMPAGAQITSDEIDFSLIRGQDYFVSFYLADMTLLGCGTNDTGPLCRFSYAEGDFSNVHVMPEFHTATMETAFFLDTIDVLTDDEAAHALVCYGDSITAQAWPDYLMLRVLREEREHLSVIRRGIGGSRVLRQYETLLNRHYGSKGQVRFEREISAAGVDRVVILHGINDIIHPIGSTYRPWSDLPTAEELIEGLRWYVNKAHELGKKVYLATIMPIKGWTTYNEQRNEIRTAVNNWIRTQTEADGVVDFDLANRDPADPLRLTPAFDHGDHLHPSWPGAENMAESVPGAYLD